MWEDASFQSQLTTDGVGGHKLCPASSHPWGLLSSTWRPGCVCCCGSPGLNTRLPALLVTSHLSPLARALQHVFLSCSSAALQAETWSLFADRRLSLAASLS